MPWLEGKTAEGAGTESAVGEVSPGARLVLGQEGVAGLCKVKAAAGARGWRQDPGVRSRQPRARRGRARWGLVPAPAGSRLQDIPRAWPWPGPSPRPVPPLPLTSQDVQGEGHQEAEPGAAGPPGSRCCALRHQGAHPSHRRRGLGGRLRWPRAAGHLPRPLGAGPLWPAESQQPPARPPARGCSSQTMERELEQEVGGRTRSTWAAPPPRRVLVPDGSPTTGRPRTQSREEGHSPWRPNSGGLTHLCQEGRAVFCSLPLGSSRPRSKKSLPLPLPRPTSSSPVKASDT